MFVKALLYILQYRVNLDRENFKINEAKWRSYESVMFRLDDTFGLVRSKAVMTSKAGLLLMAQQGSVSDIWTKCHFH